MTTYITTPAKMHSGHDIRDERGHMVAIVHSAKIAALMAAAPDLLAALKEMYALYEDHAQYDEEGYETAAINAARAAIARATGFAP